MFRTIITLIVSGTLLFSGNITINSRLVNVKRYRCIRPAVWHHDPASHPERVDWGRGKAGVFKRDTEPRYKLVIRKERNYK